MFAFGKCRKYEEREKAMLIGHLKGVIEEKFPNLVVIDVHGIGFNVHISTSTFEDLPDVGNEIKIYTHTEVKEEIFSLYGFLNRMELEFFEKLIGVNTIGPTVAMKALSGISVPSLISAIATGDEKKISKLPGIGTKKAQLILVHLKDKIHLEDALATNFAAATASATNENDYVTHMTDNTQVSDSILALVALGYSNSQSKNAVNEFLKERKTAGLQDCELTSDTILKGAFKYL